MGLRRASRLTAALAAFALLAAACGSDTSGADDAGAGAAADDGEGEGEGDASSSEEEGGALGNVAVDEEAARCETASDRDRGEYAPNGEVTFATTLGLNSYNPFDDQTPATFAYYSWVYEGLVRQGADGIIEPWLARCWEVNDDGTQVTFTLNEDVTFQDGASFDAEAVKANIDHVMTAGPPAVIPPVAGQMASIVESVEVIDPQTVQFNLLGPGEALLLSGLIRNSGFMVSPESLGTVAENPVGTGPYTFESASADQLEFQLAPNEDYWLPGEVGLEGVTLSAVPDNQARFDAFEAGQYDVSIILTEQADSTSASITRGTSVRIGWVIADWTGQDVPALASKDVRCAIAASVNRDGLQEQAGIPETATKQFATGPDDYAWIDDLESPDFSLERAAELFDQSGEDPFTMSNGHLPGSFWAGQPATLATALAELDITLDNEALDPPTGAEMFTRLAEGRYPIQIIPYNEPNALMSLIARTGESPFNPSGETPEGVLDLIESARGKSFEEGEADVAEAMKIMIEECVFIFNNVLPTFIAYQDGIEGVEATTGIPTHFWPQGVTVTG